VIRLCETEAINSGRQIPMFELMAVKDLVSITLMFVRITLTLL